MEKFTFFHYNLAVFFAEICSPRNLKGYEGFEKKIILDVGKIYNFGNISTKNIFTENNFTKNIFATFKIFSQLLFTPLFTVDCRKQSPPNPNRWGPHAVRQENLESDVPGLQRLEGDCTGHLALGGLGLELDLDVAEFDRGE